jgi:phosphopantetheinyl transferase (holo-ACP synthase)
MEKRKKFKRVVPENIKVEDLTVEDIVCGTTKCSDGFHCYSLKKTSIRKFGKERVCKECGTDLIDWERIHKNDIKDSDFIFKELKHEIVRHVFWHTHIEDGALYGALTTGRNALKEKAKKVLNTRIKKYSSFIDGRQTPMGKDEIINYAQHATATCCRKCLEAWHNIPMENTLTDSQMDFCTSLVMKYVNERIPQLKDEGIDEKKAEKIISNEYN